MEHGRCLEGWMAAREACERAMVAASYAGRHVDHDPEVARCAQDMRDWSALAREFPALIEVDA